MSKMSEFILRASKKDLRLAIGQSIIHYEQNFHKLLKEKVELLASRMGQVLLENGYRDFSKEEVRITEQDYGTQVGVGIFLTGEKYDDMRGFMLATFRELEEAYHTRDAVIEKNAALMEGVRDLFKSTPMLAEAIFPNFIPAVMEDEE